MTIEIEWDGPYFLDTIKKCNENQDYGVYFAVGQNQQLTENQVIFVGSTTDSTFSVEIPESLVWTKSTAFFVGRIGGEKIISVEKHFKITRYVESKMIQHLCPSLNTIEENNKGFSFDEALIINSGECRNYLPLVLCDWVYDQSAYSRKTWKAFTRI